MTTSYQEIGKETNDGGTLMDARQSTHSKSRKINGLRSWQLVVLIAGSLTIGAVMGSVAVSTLSTKTDEGPKSRMARALNSAETEMIDPTRLQIELCNKKYEKLQQKVAQLREKSGLDEEKLKQENEEASNKMRQKDESFEAERGELKKQIDVLRGNLMEKDTRFVSEKVKWKDEIDELKEILQKKDESLETGQGKLKKQIDELRGELVDKDTLMSSLQARLDRCTAGRPMMRPDEGSCMKDKDDLVKQVHKCNSTLQAATAHVLWWKLGKCEYSHFVDYANFSLAETVCEAYDAHLASIHSQEEQEFIHKRVAHADYSFWIGLHKLPGSNEWRWTDQSLGRYPSWYGGEPNERPSSGIIGAVLDQRTKRLFDAPGARGGPFLCKRCKI